MIFLLPNTIEKIYTFSSFKISFVTLSIKIITYIKIRF